jgi:hypothetical protein
MRHKADRALWVWMWMWMWIGGQGQSATRRILSETRSPNNPRKFPRLGRHFISLPHLSATAALDQLFSTCILTFASYKQQRAFSHRRSNCSLNAGCGVAERRWRPRARQNLAGVCTMTKSHFSYVQARIFSLFSLFCFLLWLV